MMDEEAEIVEVNVNAFLDYFGLDQKLVNQIFFLSLLCGIIPLVQIFIISIACYYPKLAIVQTTAQNFENTKKTFMALVRSALTISKQHRKVLLEDWLVVKEINTNNYEEEDRSKFKKEFGEDLVSGESADTLQNKDGRKANMIDIDTTIWIKQALEGAEQQQNTSQIGETTPMMKVINYHVKVIGVTSRFERLNYGMNLSDETNLRRDRLPFRGVVDLLRTVDDTPRFPATLEYSVIRNVKDTKDWNYATKGLRLDPIILSEKPWPKLKKTADSFLLSFYMDIATYWFQIWISVVFLNIVFAK